MIRPAAGCPTYGAFCSEIDPKRFGNPAIQTCSASRDVRIFNLLIRRGEASKLQVDDRDLCLTWPLSRRRLIGVLSTTMGIDAGFDMVPRLSKSIKDKEDWDRFMSIINQEYKDNAQVEVTSSYIVFKAGEHPMLPFEGHKFLRFSSKISGNIAGATGVFSYIRKVTRIAKEQFGPRIKYWDETAEQHGYYDWRDVHESFRSYREV